MDGWMNGWKKGMNECLTTPQHEKLLGVRKRFEGRIYVCMYVCMCVCMYVCM